MQMCQTFQIPEMAGLLCFPPEWDVSGDSIKRRSPAKTKRLEKLFERFQTAVGPRRALN